MPCRGPRDTPALTSLSATLACSRACSDRIVMNALICGFSSSITFRQASTTATGEIFPSRMLLPISLILAYGIVVGNDLDSHYARYAIRRSFWPLQLLYRRAAGHRQSSQLGQRSPRQAGARRGFYSLRVRRRDASHQTLLRRPRRLPSHHPCRALGCRRAAWTSLKACSPTLQRALRRYWSPAISQSCHCEAIVRADGRNSRNATGTIVCCIPHRKGWHRHVIQYFGTTCGLRGPALARDGPRPRRIDYGAQPASLP